MKLLHKLSALVVAAVLLLGLLPARPAEALSANNAVVVSTTIPATMVAGVTYKVAVTMKNTGSNTWTSAKSYRLVAVGSDPFTTTLSYSLTRTDAIRTNQSKVFYLTLKAPAKAGSYTTDWRMTKGTSAFGATLVKKVTVVPVALSSLVITTPAKKLVYIVGEKLDLTGLVVTGVYNNGSRKVMTVTAANVTGFNSSAPASGQVLTITIGGKKVTYKVTINAIPAPSGIKALAVSSTEISLKWNAVSGAVKYRVYYSRTATGTYSLLGSVVNASCVVSNLQPNTAYYFKISTVGVYGEGPKSGFVGAQTFNLTAEKAQVKKELNADIAKVNTLRASIIAQMQALADEGQQDSAEYQALSEQLSDVNVALSALTDLLDEVDSATTYEDLYLIEDQAAAIMDSL